METRTLRDDASEGRFGGLDALAVGGHVVHLHGGAEGHRSWAFVRQCRNEIVDGEGGVE